LKALLDSTSSEEVQAVMIKALDDSFWANRQIALKAFENYEGENFTLIEASLIDMAKSDPESLVRADAVNLLSSIDVEKYEEVYRIGMNDSSYSVAGISLYGFAATQAPDKVEIFEKFEKSQNINLVLPLADFYAQTGQYDKYEWFEGKLFEINGGNLWYLIQMFGEFLMDAPAYVQKRGAGLLESMARNNNQYYVRLAAYQALGLLEELDNMPAIRENIRNQEKDERLNQIYQNIP
jgi:aminopeptidase N